MPKLYSRMTSNSIRAVLACLPVTQPSHCYMSRVSPRFTPPHDSNIYTQFRGIPPSQVHIHNIQISAPILSASDSSRPQSQGLLCPSTHHILMNVRANFIGTKSQGLESKLHGLQGPKVYDFPCLFCASSIRYSTRTRFYTPQIPGSNSSILFNILRCTTVTNLPYLWLFEVTGIYLSRSRFPSYSNTHTSIIIDCSARAPHVHITDPAVQNSRRRDPGSTLCLIVYLDYRGSDKGILCLFIKSRGSLHPLHT
jgi:hypothetical protein